MSDEVPYELVVTPPVVRAITTVLPEKVAAAAVEFITSSLLADPKRVGRPLKGDLVGVWAARRGTYRVLYRIRDDLGEVIVLRIDHRRDAYRPL